ncbi:transcriptional repressor [Phaeobacter gallaeciensis]|uniref:Transcriptional repressor n=2 Tax=Roseobacteraceae TaxID=2854170 RepID=A0A366WXU4_9RHOB|nr:MULTISPECIES: transcriptional repressor [Roseobacteraceae]MBT3141191.1 transcriptional repressor [Falsiruegeria litorea]MBT8170810.1 transcriptional repressor [Falsiruegeria litorea]RBW54490.1 transcriptional repressor [Phaeobacter gallaeciensis]
MAAIGFTHHDHSCCIQNTVDVADKHCKQAGLQLTPIRKRVLEILLEEHRALGAYEILDRLRQENLGSQPPVAYRALDFLVKNGFAHKIERMNAFVACTQPGEVHTPVFMICRECDTVAESASELSKSQLGRTAKDLGFTIERIVIEAEGLCPNCQDATAS